MSYIERMGTILAERTEDGLGALLKVQLDETGGLFTIVSAYKRGGRVSAAVMYTKFYGKDTFFVTHTDLQSAVDEVVDILYENNKEKF